jgi:cytochrome b-561
MLAAIMIYKVLPTWKHDTTKQIHLVLHAIALVLGAFGIYCAFKFHNESGIANLYSLHSWLGIGTICLYGTQVIPYTRLHTYELTDTVYFPIEPIQKILWF